MLPAALVALLLAACGTQLLEDTGEAGAVPNCGEPFRLFKSFTVQAKKISWSASPGSASSSSTLTIDLVFENTAKWPLALSNSGDGILYSVEYALLGNNGASRAPTQTNGVADERPLDKPGEGHVEKPDEKQKGVGGVHLRIKPGQREEGQLVFQAPRGDYLLAIERRFAGKPVPGHREDHLSTCKISSANFSAPAGRGVSGVY